MCDYEALRTARATKFPGCGACGRKFRGEEKVFGVVVRKLAEGAWVDREEYRCKGCINFALFLPANAIVSVPAEEIQPAVKFLERFYDSTVNMSQKSNPVVPKAASRGITQGL